MSKYTLIVMPDEDSEAPRDWENLGTMVCWHNRYNLGDENPGEDWIDYFASLVENKKWNHNEDFTEEEIIQDMDNKFIYLPLYLYDHSGITMNTSGFSCIWDSGQCGYIYVSIADAKAEFGWKVLTKGRRKQVEDSLRMEIHVYDQFLTGDVYGYVITDEEEDVIDSCWGFYGEEVCLEEGNKVLMALVNGE